MCTDLFLYECMNICISICRSMYVRGRMQTCNLIHGESRLQVDCAVNEGSGLVTKRETCHGSLLAALRCWRGCAAAQAAVETVIIKH